MTEDNDWKRLSATWDGSITDVRVDGKKIQGVTGLSLTSTGFEWSDEVEEAVAELKKNFEFQSFHEERVKKLLRNDNSLTDDLNHLVIAASLMLSDAGEMKSGNLRAFEMGDKIIIEEKPDDEWQVTRTIGIQIAQILAHARAKKRVKEIEELVGGLGHDPMDRLDEFDEPSTGPFDGTDDHIYPWDIGDPVPSHDDYGPTWTGGDTYTMNANQTGKSQQEKIQEIMQAAADEMEKEMDKKLRSAIR